jgi:drug/metabolite transporter (DMT)-like permease
MVCFSDVQLEKGVPMGALWAVFGSMMYAFYLVSLRRNVDHEDKLIQISKFEMIFSGYFGFLHQ